MGVLLLWRRDTMKFRKYSSIENAYRTKTVDYITETGNAGGEWVSTLKIHGANYSIWSNGEDVRHAKRSGWIEGESFYGDYNFNYDENVKQIRQHIKSHLNSDADVVAVYGEIYGGLYDHPDVERDKSAVRVQKEVQYRPDNSFIAFDIRVDGKLIDHDRVVYLCDKFGIPHVPVLGRGSFDDLLKMDVKFLDPIGEILGLPPIPGNYAEGWVLKPVVPKFFGNGERIILKGKNPKMSEKSKKIGKPKKPVIELSEKGSHLRDELISLINENRLRNVLSHGEIEQVSQKDFGRLMGLFSKDAFDDFLKDNQEEWDTLEKKEQVAIKKEMNKTAGDVIRPNFVNIIDGEF
jgi:Rnl2 family RNA ligase